MDSVLERQRHSHEDIERLEQAITDRLVETARTVKDRLGQEHQVAAFLDRIATASQELLDSYADTEGLFRLVPKLMDSARKAEIEGLSKGFDEFYRQLRDIKDYHLRYPNSRVENLEESYKKKPHIEGQEEEIDVMFSGEEGSGQYLDLLDLHEQWLNIKGVKRCTYLQYLDSFDNFNAIPRALKKEQYLNYLENLHSYLKSFYSRVKPLENHETFLKSIEEDAEQQWNEEKLGWSDGSTSDIFCQACQRHYSKQSVYDAHLVSKKHKKAVSEVDSSHKSPRDKALATKEYCIRRILDTLKFQRAETKNNVERRQTLTGTERQKEVIDIETRPEDHDDENQAEDTGRIYNPLNLPLGWDGKPIPFWLYKLHGLGVEYSCEVCSSVYMGRKAFEKHFTEWKHVHGLRCLGIQTSALFKEITKIDDALALWEKVKADKRIEEAAHDATIEMEDSEGNVMTKTVFEDLKRQGLL